jgi:transcription elongation factor Elf1
VLACPNCGKETISAWRKFSLGPAVSTRCKECGAKISVSWRSLIGLVPVLLSFFAASHLGNFWGALAVVAAFAFYGYYHQVYVPLVCKNAP